MCVDGGKREKEMMEEIVTTVRYRPKASRQNCAQPFGYLPYLIASALLLYRKSKGKGGKGGKDVDGHRLGCCQGTGRAGLEEH